jgi:hypothetical protein
MEKAKRVYAVKPANGTTGKTRLVRATRRSQVESFLLGDFTIEPAGVDEALELARNGAQVEDATA